MRTMIRIPERVGLLDSLCITRNKIEGMTEYTAKVRLAERGNSGWNWTTNEHTIEDGDPIRLMTRIMGMMTQEEIT